VRSIFRFPLETGRAELRESVSIRFSATGTIAIKQGDVVEPEDVRDLALEITVAPPDEARRWKKSARLEIRLAGRPERYFPFAQQIATEVATLLGFFYTGLHVLGGLAEAELVPENVDEETELGDNRFIMQMSFREVDGAIPFDRGHLRLFPFVTGLDRVIRQFNVAKEAQSEIDGYLGMFKVIETLYYRGRARTSATLKADDELCEIVGRSFRQRDAGQASHEPDEEDIALMIHDFVATRDQCAHLRGHNAFGYAPCDAEVLNEVEPLLDIITIVAREAIRRRLNSQSGGLLPDLYGPRSPE
jgi:hypothetical protein